MAPGRGRKGLAAMMTQLYLANAMVEGRRRHDLDLILMRDVDLARSAARRTRRQLRRTAG